MSVSVLSMSMSLDGYIAGANDGPDNPGGDGFMRLHEWFHFGADGKSASCPPRPDIGAHSVEAEAGQIVIVPAGISHEFVNTGECPLRQIDIHANPKFITEWLEY